MTTYPIPATSVAVLRDGYILLGRRKGSHGAGLYALPGGRVEGHPDMCARRELYEETGMRGTAWKPLHKTVYEEFETESFVVMLYATIAGPDEQPVLREPDKCEGWKWFSLYQPPAKQECMAGAREFLRSSALWEYAEQHYAGINL